MTSFQVISFNHDQPKTSVYKRRKAHHKEKTGCLACRAKRVKCDEAKPECDRCTRNGRACCYSDAPRRSLDLAISKSQILSETAITQLESAAENRSGNGIPTHMLTQYLDQNAAEILGTSANTGIITEFKSDPLIQSTLLALAASHLRYTSPQTVEYRITEHTQQVAALTEFRKTIESPFEELGQSRANGLLLGAMLLNLLAFVLPDNEAAGCGNPYTSWIFSTDKTRLGFFALQAGIRPLAESVSVYYEHAAEYLTPLLLGDRATDWRDLMRHGMDNVPQRWKENFGLQGNIQLGDSCEMHSPEDVYRAPLVVLAQIYNFPAHRKMIFFCMAFLGKLHSGFRHLLEVREPKAMWIFGYWAGVMCRHENLWWCERRVKRDYEAAKEWLRMSRLREQSAQWAEMMDELENVYIPGDSSVSSTP